jgi:hypothetical protein
MNEKKSISNKRYRESHEEEIKSYYKLHRDVIRIQQQNYYHKTGKHKKKEMYVEHKEEILSKAKERYTKGKKIRNQVDVKIKIVDKISVSFD